MKETQSLSWLLTVQVAREAYFKGQSYLDLSVDNLPDITDMFYAGVGFRTDQRNALLLQHQAQVLPYKSTAQAKCYDTVKVVCI